MKAGVAALKERLQSNQPKVMWLSLGLLDFAMDKAGANMVTHVGANDFMQTLI